MCKEFAPQTFIDLNNAEVFVSLSGVLQWIIDNSALPGIQSRKWEIGDLSNFLKKHDIDIVSKHRKDLSFSFIDRNDELNKYTGKADKPEIVEMLNSKNLLKLIKKLQRDNSCTKKEYQETMFKGFYLNQKNGLLFLNLREVLYSFVNNSKLFKPAKFQASLSELKIFAKKNGIKIDLINSEQVEFITIPEINRPKTTDQNFSSIFDDTADDTAYGYQVVDKNTATSQTIEVLGVNSLCSLYQAMQEILPAYDEVAPGVICPTGKNSEEMYSLEDAYEAINRRTERSNIDITKSAVRKQVKKLIIKDPKKYKTEIIDTKLINYHGNIKLYPKSRETYLSSSLFDAILDFYLSNYDDIDFNPGPQFSLELPSINEEFQKRAVKESNNYLIVNYDTVNEIEAAINYYKDSFKHYVKDKEDFLKPKLDYLYEGISQNIAKSDVSFMMLEHLDSAKMVLKMCNERCIDYPEPKLRKIMQRIIPQAYQQLINDRGKQDYKLNVKIPLKKINEINQKFEMDYNEKVRKLYSKTIKDFNEVVQTINSIANKAQILVFLEKL